MGEKSRRWRHLAKLGIATAMLQLAYWFGVQPLLFGAPRLPPLYSIEHVEAAVLAGPDAAALARARFSATTIPWSDCCAPGYRAVRFDVVIPVVPDQGIALVPNADADNLQVRINGQIVDGRGRMTLPRPTFEVNVKRVIHVPAAVFHPGPNRVEYVMARQVLPYFDVMRPIFTDYAAAWPSFKFREFILTSYELMGVAVGAVIALFAIVLLLRSSQRGLALSLFALVASWSLLAQFYFWVDPPFSADLRMLYYFALTNLLPVAWFNFADQWTRRPFRLAPAASLLAYGLCMATTLWSLRSLPVPDGFDRASDFADWFGLALSAAAILRFLWHVVVSEEERVTEFAVFALCITLLAADLANELLSDTASGYVIRSMPLLLIAFLAAFLARNIRLFQSTHEINQILRVRLEAREAELAETHRRESDLVRREAHQAERQRLMRDMHDGVGSQLTSMLFAARRGALPAGLLADSLQTVIDEIRLLIDSMDATGDSLGGALGSFRQRTAQRLAAAGITLDVEPVLPDALPAYGPREVLHVLRILQESVTNALRHSGCSRIALEARTTGDVDFPLELVVRDDGRGFPDHAAPGRGLANMEARAAAIGGRLLVERGSSGVVVHLLLPAARIVAPP